MFIIINFDVDFFAGSQIYIARIVEFDSKTYVAIEGGVINCFHNDVLSRLIFCKVQGF